MRQNVSQAGIPGVNNRFYIVDDWFPGGIPANVDRAEHVYIDSSYSFGAFHSIQPQGLTLAEGSGCYDTSTFITGENGSISIGEFTILNATTLVCNASIKVGAHCMLAWGSVVTDSWLPYGINTLELRKKQMYTVASDPNRRLPVMAEPLPVVLEDNCWIGFGAIIMPGVRVGRGAVVGSKTIITKDVPAYTVVVGQPAKIVKYLTPDDTAEAKSLALKHYLA